MTFAISRRFCYDSVMATIMQSGNRRCDGVCHQAKGSKCACVCQGRYHGASVNRSMTAERKDIEEIAYWKAAAAVRPTVDSNLQPELDFGVADVL